MADCFYCELPMKGRDMTKGEALAMLGIKVNTMGADKLLVYMEQTREHLVRKADGGRQNRHNIVLAHKFCNTSRQKAAVEDHKRHMLLKVADGQHPLAMLCRRGLMQMKNDRG